MNQSIVELMEVQIKDLHDQLRKSKIKWVENDCPVKVGSDTEANGYSHNGKLMCVESVTVRQQWAREKHWEWFAIGHIIKKDGDVGMQRGEWTCKI